jgi:hypothetical protein
VTVLSTRTAFQFRFRATALLLRTCILLYVDVLHKSTPGHNVALEQDLTANANAGFAVNNTVVTVGFLSSHILSCRVPSIDLGCLSHR